MKKRQYDLNFKKMVIAKGKEIGNMTAVARQHELDPKMVLRWARELNRKDLDQLDENSVKQTKFVPTAEAVKHPYCGHCTSYSTLIKELL